MDAWPTNIPTQKEKGYNMPNYWTDLGLLGVSQFFCPKRIKKKKREREKKDELGLFERINVKRFPALVSPGKLML